MLGDKILELRKSRKLTQKQLADELGVAQSTIGMLEKNERGAGNDLLIKIAKYFNVSTDYLLSTEEKLDMAMDVIDKIKLIAKETLDNAGVDLNNSIYAINAEFDGEKFTEEEKKEIVNFIKYVISKRDNK